MLEIRRAEPTRANEELLGANYSPAREELDSSPDGSRPALDSREGSGASCAVTRPRRAGEPRARAASGGGSGGVRTGRGGREGPHGARASSGLSEPRRLRGFPGRGDGGRRESGIGGSRLGPPLGRGDEEERGGGGSGGRAISAAGVVKNGSGSGRAGASA